MLKNTWNTVWALGLVMNTGAIVSASIMIQLQRNFPGLRRQGLLDKSEVNVICQYIDLAQWESGIRSLSTYLSSNHNIQKLPRRFPLGLPKYSNFSFLVGLVKLVGVDKSHIENHLVPLNWCGQIIWDDNINCHIWDILGWKGNYLSPNDRELSAAAWQTRSCHLPYTSSIPTLNALLRTLMGQSSRTSNKKRVTA